MIHVDRVSGAGFTTVEAFVEGLDDFAGYQLQVQAKNENYIARCFDVSSGKRVEGPVLACTPDLITIIDSESGEHNMSNLSLLNTSLAFWLSKS